MHSKESINLNDNKTYLKSRKMKYSYFIKDNNEQKKIIRHIIFMYKKLMRNFLKITLVKVSKVEFF